MNVASLAILLENSFTLVFIAFAACALFLFLERDRVPEQFRTALRVAVVYLSIAAVNYFYMRTSYSAAIASGAVRFPTAFRYIDWILTTPLMLLKFPLLLGIGPKGRQFMIRLVVLDLTMIITGLIGEIRPDNPLVHHGMFLIGCLAWLLILALLFQALAILPDRIGPALRNCMRTMGVFVVLGWAIYPLGYMMPLLGLPPHVRELVYNVADIVNKCGICLVVYVAAKETAIEQLEAGRGFETDGEEVPGMAAGGAYAGR